MAGPWEEYQPKAAEAKPWEEYGAAPPAPTASSSDSPADVKAQLKADAPLQREALGTGILDPIVGGAQLLSHAVPDSVRQAIDHANNWLASQGLPLAKIPEGGMDQVVKDREAEIKKENLPAGWRLLGNAISPANLLPASGGPIRQAITMGARAGALEPTEKGGDDFAEAKLKQVFEGAGVGGLVGTAGKVAAGMIAPSVNADVKKLLDAGVKLTPGQMATEKLANVPRRVEEAAKSVPVTGSFIRNAEREAIDSFNLATANKALSPIGVAIPPGTAGRDIVAMGQSALSHAYDQIVPNLSLSMDPPLSSDIISAASKFKAMMREDDARQFDNYVKQAVYDRFMNAAHGVVTGDLTKQMQSELGKFVRDYRGSQDGSQKQLANGVEAIDDAIRDAITRQNPNYAQRLQDIDTAYAMFVRVENAAARRVGSDGRFMPADLLQAIKSEEKSVRKRAFARGDSLMQGWGETANRVIANRLPDSGTTERAMYDIVGGGALAALNPKILAGIGATAAPYTKPGLAAARAYAQPSIARRGVADALRAGAPMMAPAAADAITRPGAVPPNLQGILP